MKDHSSYSKRKRQPWATLLKKVWNIDALKYPKCGGQMKVISFIDQPFVIRRILKHLDLWENVTEPESKLVPSGSTKTPDLHRNLWSLSVNRVQTTFHGRMMYRR